MGRDTHAALLLNVGSDRQRISLKGRDHLIAGTSLEGTGLCLYALNHGASIAVQVHTVCDLADQQLHNFFMRKNQ